jgi:hypothetical protein
MHIIKLIAAGSALVLGACATSPAPRDTPLFESSGLLLGHVNFTSKLAAPIVVVALDQTNGKIVHRAFLEANRAFQLPLAAGHYKFYAFADVNRDGVLSADEPASVMYSLSDEIRAGGTLELPALRVDLRARVAQRP